MKIKGTLYFLLIIVIVLLNNCDDRDRINPWDLKNTLDPSDWAPQNLEIELISNTERKLTWHYGDHNIEGFKIDRKEEDGEWKEAYATLGNETRSWNDTKIVPDASLTYSYRVYAYAGGNESDYDEVAYIPLEVTTNEATNITPTSATSGGYVVGSHVDSRGIAYGTSANPDITGSTVAAGSGEGSFTAEMTGLNSGFKYYVRAYATNNAGTFYGNEVMFETNVQQFILTLSANPSDAGSVAGGGYYQAGEEINITATANAGWEFTEWTGNYAGNLNDVTATEAILIMPADDAKLTANFLWPIDDETEVVDVLNPATGKTWMDRNLGASRAAISSTDDQAYGDLYQWGRAADGHQKRNSGTTSTLSSSDLPGHGNFITVNNSPYDWRNPQNSNLWQGGSGVNNPCPPGYRIPTNAEWQEEFQSWGSNDAAGAFASPLKLPSAGFRSGSSGSITAMGSHLFYWSKTVDGSYSLYLYTNGTVMPHLSRAHGFSVRCIKE